MVDAAALFDAVVAASRDARPASVPPARADSSPTYSDAHAFLALETVEALAEAVKAECAATMEVCDVAFTLLGVEKGASGVDIAKRIVTTAEALEGAHRRVLDEGLAPPGGRIDEVGEMAQATPANSAELGGARGALAAVHRSDGRVSRGTSFGISLESTRHSSTRGPRWSGLAGCAMRLIRRFGTRVGGVGRASQPELCRSSSQAISRCSTGRLAPLQDSRAIQLSNLEELAHRLRAVADEYRESKPDENRESRFTSGTTHVGWCRYAAGITVAPRRIPFLSIDRPPRPCARGI